MTRREPERGEGNEVEKKFDEILDRWKSFLDNVDIIEELERPQSVSEVRRQLLAVVDEQIEYKGVGVFYVKPPLFRALRDNRQTFKNSREV